MIARELGHHLPFSVASALAGVLLVVALSAFGLDSSAYRFFHVFHPAHMLLSAAATTAMFWRHDRRIVRAAAIGFVGSVGVCWISDVGLPYCGGLLLGANMEIHLCVVEHPPLILSAAVIGIVCGLVAAEAVRRSTFYSHSAHVLISSAASTLYLTSFGISIAEPAMIGWSVPIVLVSVMIPCCFSDIVFPLLFVVPESPRYRCGEDLGCHSRESGNPEGGVREK
ncbi:MAG: hypothetical protein RDV41_04190 [Planctomycetota bacterium]|nr:hypothetical protein [Planctomycetota bacterium]